MKTAAPVAIFVLCASIALACRSPARAGGDAAAQGGPPGACEKLGAPCTVGPGKLGTCVEVERPERAAAFVCQSQH